MTTRTTPRHRRPDSYAGSTPRGPARWARAADNALRNPNSRAAQLYFDRIARARAVVKYLPEREGHFQYEQFEWVGRDMPREWKRKHAFCSLFCAAMGAQLSWGINEQAPLFTLFSDEEGKYTVEHTAGNGYKYTQFGQQRLTPLDRRDITRTISCFYCNSSIKPVKR